MKRYKDSTIIKNDNNIEMFETKFYDYKEPTSNDEYIITKRGDRLDLFASQYYNDVTKWVEIADANNIITNGSLVLQSGLQIRIPFA